MEQHYFIYREPENFDELKVLLLLRYRVYRESRLQKFIEENEACIDLDCYDLYSRHFGLYEHIDDTSRPVGYIRMVTEETGTFRDELFELAKSIPSLYEKVNSIPRYPFPLMNYCPYVVELRKFYKEVKFQGDNLVEASRLSLDVACRGLNIISYFVAATIAQGKINCAEEALLACNRNHEAIYRRGGAEVFRGTKEFDVKGAGSVLLLLSPNRLSVSMKAKVYKMAEVYKRFGRICYNPSEPENYYPPLGAFIKSKPVFNPAVNRDVESDPQIGQMSQGEESDSQSDKGDKESRKSICEMDSAAKAA